MKLPLPELEHSHVGSVGFITDEALASACGVRIAFMGRDGGVSEGPYKSLNTADHVGDDLRCVQQNREIALRAIGFPAVPLVVPNQVHGTDIVRVSSADAVAAAPCRGRCDADAVMVEVPGVAALLNSADCLLLVIVAPSGRFSVVHAGWRGALVGIAGKAARELAAGEPDGATGFNAYIGPHIRSECFEASQDIVRRFAAVYGDGVQTDERHVSLSRVVALDLMRAGMSTDRIADVGVCTVCASDRYFSYRVHGVCGRQATIAVRAM